MAAFLTTVKGHRENIRVSMKIKRAPQADKTPHNTYTGVWVDGGATTVGRREKLKENPHSVIFWNEIGCNDLADVRLMKQITEGQISYMKHGDLEETRFTGLLVGWLVR